MDAFTPIIDISQGPLASDDVFASDPAFLAAAQKRYDDMLSFMKALGVSNMRTHLLNSAGQGFKVSIKL